MESDEIVVEILEGEEEDMFLKKARSDMLKRRNQPKGRRRGRGIFFSLPRYFVIIIKKLLYSKFLIHSDIWLYRTDKRLMYCCA